MTMSDMADIEMTTLRPHYDEDSDNDDVWTAAAIDSIIGSNTGISKEAKKYVAAAVVLSR